MLYELIGHADFLYVADCKLASRENLSHIATRGGRFVTVLPRGRSEDIAFRQRLRAAPSVLKWTLLYALTNDQGHIVDELFVCGDDHVHSEGYRLLWYRSTRKAEQDKSRRARSIQKATAALSDLRQRLQGPRTRFRERSKVEQAVAEVLTEAEASSWLLVEIEEKEEETFRQATRGRPSEQTKYLTGLWRFYLICVVFSLSNSAPAGRRTLGASCVQTYPCLRRLWLCSQHALAVGRK